MEGESPFASLQSLPSFDDGPADSPLDVLGLGSFGSTQELRQVAARGRRARQAAGATAGGRGGGQ